MENIVFYFSGTGNSLKVAKTLAKALGNCEIVSMAKAEKISLTKPCDTVGFVYPVYYWGLPKTVVEFVKNTNFNNTAAYYYSIATYGGIVGNAIRQLNELLNEHGITLNYGEKIRMVGNYIIGYDIFVNINKCLKQADKKLFSIIVNIKNRKIKTIKKPYKIIERNYKEAMQKISLLVKEYTVNENCVGCGICKEVCPAKNIEIINKRPVFKDNCEQCVACIQWCPKKAINYKDKTQKRKRYVHPEVSYKELSEYNNK
ncbi:MAG: EFR1 family ferrodoxin [Treponema sp.]|jgi:ferredoxin/flavodoxin|nr:EFR1 family ferrodoxin [Treponema sp.]